MCACWHIHSFNLGKAYLWRKYIKKTNSLNHLVLASKENTKKRQVPDVIHCTLEPKCIICLFFLSGFFLPCDSYKIAWRFLLQIHYQKMYFKHNNMHVIISSERWSTCHLVIFWSLIKIITISESSVEITVNAIQDLKHGI